MSRAASTCGEGGTLQIRPILNKGRVVGTRLLVLRKDVAATPTNHYLDGRHVIVMSPSA